MSLVVDLKNFNTGGRIRQNKKILKQMCRSFQDQNILCNNYTTENSSVAQEIFGGFTKR